MFTTALLKNEEQTEPSLVTLNVFLFNFCLVEVVVVEGIMISLQLERTWIRISKLRPLRRKHYF